MKLWKDMLNKEGLIAIAKLDGWTKICKARDSANHEHFMFCGTPSNTLTGTTPSGTEYRTLPSYLNDLNAMHRLEIAMTGPQKWEFDRQLGMIAGNTHNVISATAPQRAEAYYIAMTNGETNEKS